VIPARYARLFAAAVMGAASISAANAWDGFTTDSKHHHDGTYAVYITTNRGDCDKHYHWMILVSGGRVSSAGHTPMNASGHINPRGNVHLTFKRFPTPPRLPEGSRRRLARVLGTRRPWNAPVRGTRASEATEHAGRRFELKERLWACAEL
jgi:hypothetical protein